MSGDTHGVTVGAFPAPRAPARGRRPFDQGRSFHEAGGIGGRPITTKVHGDALGHLKSPSQHTQAAANSNLQHGSRNDAANRQDGAISSGKIHSGTGLGLAVRGRADDPRWRPPPSAAVLRRIAAVRRARWRGGSRCSTFPFRRRTIEPPTQGRNPSRSRPGHRQPPGSCGP